MDKTSAVTPSPHRGVYIPGFLLPIYALLLLALGWFSGQQWSHRTITATEVTSTGVTPPTPVSPPTARAADSVREAPSAVELADNALPPLHYSAHIYASDDTERSITLNGERYHEGDHPLEGLLIEQIQQDVTLFRFNGDLFTLNALEDWPGGLIEDARRLPVEEAFD